jgi:uncharacterized protein YkwD
MPRTIGQALGFLLGFFIALWLSPMRIEAVGPESGGAFSALEQGLYLGVNEVRAQRNLITLERRPELDAVARAHSLDMARRHFLAHETPEGTNALHRLEAGGVDGFTLAAENLGATNRADPNREILVGWLNSKVHRDNLLAPPFNATGIGVARSDDGALYYTQLYVTYPR